MKKLFLHIIVIFLAAGCKVQLLQLPAPVTNQASAALLKDKTFFIYTFYGLDSTKKWSGVHNKVFRVNSKTGQAKQLGDVPDSFGRLAASAAVIKNKAYLVGGYSVFENGTEKSSNQLFIFNPVTELFTKGMDIPVAIDDHAQAISRDSLLFVISGWNDSNNARAVHVYNPFINQWQLATSLPLLPEEWAKTNHFSMSFRRSN